jgi:hypothetical protein
MAHRVHVMLEVMGGVWPQRGGCGCFHACAQLLKKGTHAVLACVADADIRAEAIQPCVALNLPPVSAR